MILLFLGSVAAFIVAMSANGRLKTLAERLQSLEQRIGVLQQQLDAVAPRIIKPETAQAIAPAASAAEAAPASPAATGERIKFSPWQRPDPATSVATPPTPAPAVAKPPADALAAPLPPTSTSTPDLEQRLGGRYTVWVGGIAVALGALLLVRYSIEQGVFGPGMRIFLAGLLSATLIACGEWLRRSEVKIAIDGIPEANIPAVLTAAGTIAAFGTVYAAHALYGFIGPAAAFVLLGVIALATLAAALVHGAALAGLGLAGSFVTPMLVTSNNPSPWPVVMFLAVVAVAAHELARRKHWAWLGAASAVGAIAWSLLFAGAVSVGATHISAAMLHTVLQMLVAITMLVGLSRAYLSEDGKQDLLTLAILVGFAWAALVVFASNAGISWASIAFALVVVALLSASGIAASTALAVLIAGLFAVVMLSVWPDDSGLRSRAIAPSLTLRPLVPSLFVTAAALMAALVALTSIVRLWLSSKLDTLTSAIYASAATVVPLAALALADVRVAAFEPSWSGALCGLMLAAQYATVTTLLQARGGATRSAAHELTIGIFATGAAAAVALAATLGLHQGTLNAALALTAFAAAYIAGRRRIPLLRHAVAGIGLLALAHVVLAPHVGMDEIGTTPVFNWLLVGFGVPAIAFWGTARILSGNGDDMAQRTSDALAIVFATLLAFLEIRHLLNHGDVLAFTTDHVEQGLMATVGFLFSYALMRSGVSTANAVFRFASYALGIVSAVVALVSLGVLHNPAFAPAFAHERVYGFGLLNSLVLGYLLPAFSVAIVARAARTRWPQPAVFAAAGTALALLFAFVTLEVRQAFHGSNLWIGQTTSQMEFWTYSAVWLMLGIALLAYGIIRDAVDVRLASAVLVVLTVLKVFVFDLSGLGGIWRPLSFISLGLVLLGIGLIYQRFLSFPAKARPSA